MITIYSPATTPALYQPRASLVAGWDGPRVALTGGMLTTTRTDANTVTLDLTGLPDGSVVELLVYDPARRTWASPAYLWVQQGQGLILASRHHARMLTVEGQTS